MRSTKHNMFQTLRFLSFQAGWWKNKKYKLSYKVSLKRFIVAPGVYFTKLFRQAKSCRRTSFGKKFAVLSISPTKSKIRSKFAKICMPFAILLEKNPCENVDEIDSWGHFHQHFTCGSFI